MISVQDNTLGSGALFHAAAGQLASVASVHLSHLGGPSRPKATLRRKTEVASADQVLLTPEEAAGRMGISRAHVYRLIGARELDSIKIGRSRRVPVAALDDFIEGSKI